MDIKTKYNEGDALFTISNHKVVSGTVKEIDTETRDGKTTVKYWVQPEDEDCFFAYDEHSYSTKEELINSL